VESRRHGPAQRCLSHSQRSDSAHGIFAQTAWCGDWQEHSGKDRKDPSRVPADLLEEAFDLNMQLEEMRMARKMGDADLELQASLEQAKRKFDGLLDDVDRDLRGEWQVWDLGDAGARSAAQKKMVALLDRRRYINNLVRDVTETLGV